MRAFYSIIQYRPDHFRAESVNVGIVLLCESTGKLRVDVIRNYNRVCTFFPQTELINFEHSLLSIKCRIEHSLDELNTVAGLKHFADTRANDYYLTDPKLAKIDDLDKDFERLFSQLVECEYFNMASSFVVFEDYDIRMYVKVERRKNLNGDIRWGVYISDNSCYSFKEKGFIIESFPSSRTDESLKDTRFTFDQAMDIAMQTSNKIKDAIKDCKGVDKLEKISNINWEVK